MLKIGDEVEVNTDDPDNIRYFVTKGWPLTGLWLISVEPASGLCRFSTAREGRRLGGCYTARLRPAKATPW